MTMTFRFATAFTLALSALAVCTPAVSAQQQQFGPSPQAMYKQHPGSAPSYVTYEAKTTAPAAGVQTAPAPAVSTTRTPAVHKTTTAAKTTHRRSTTSKSTAGR